MPTSENLLHLIALEHFNQSGDMISFRMCQNDQLDSPVPEGQLIAKLKADLPGVRAAIDKDLLVAFLNQYTSAPSPVALCQALALLTDRSII